MMTRRLLPLLIATLLAALLPAAQPAAAAAGNSDFGVNSHIAATYDVAATRRPLEIMSEISSGWAREEFVWYRIERSPGQYDWTFYDRAIPQLAGRGVKIIGLLITAPAWATPFGGDRDGAPSFYPPDAQRFAQFAAAAAQRYRDHVSHWEIWNEPENQLYWQSGPSPAEYAGLLKAAYPAIKAANPNATVLSAGIVPTHVDFIRGIADNGAWGSFDVLAIHPYVDPFGPEDGQIGTGDVAAVKSLVARLGNKPIWATEFGWSTGPASRDPRGVDEETQANYLIRSSALLRAAGVEKVLWFRLKDTEVRNGSPFNQYGLLRYAGGITDLSQPRPSLAAFRTLNEQLGGAAPAGMLDLGGQNVVFDFETFGSWRRGDQPNGSFNPTGE
ncbi:MAG TPA: beta-galactosidase, partial [Roseiflexaceae bacterium]|nr:beta-galactosidase [Roseiflexaceae bacterium]